MNPSNANPNPVQANLNDTLPGTFKLRISRGSQVYYEGDRAESLYRLTSGLARMTKLSPSGRPVVVRHVLPGDYFGEAVLSDQTHHAEVQALTDLTFDVLPASIQDPKTLISVTKNLSEQLERTMHFEAHLQLGELRERVARYLLQLRHTPLSEVNAKEQPVLSVAQEVIAQGVNASRESASKILKEMRLEGLIDVQYRRTILLNIPALEALAQNELE
jgi:CRP/FNR family transcriptional regulator, LitR-dependent transcriptional activator